jgi:type II secretory pathway component HofQ
LPGKHEIELLGENGTSCRDQVSVKAGETTTLECTLGVIAMPEPAEVPSAALLKNDKHVSWTFKQSPFHDVMKLAAETCGFNIVVPEYLRSPVTIDLTDVACDQALEVTLVSQGFWYTYDKDANLVRVAPRKDLAAEAKAAQARPAPSADDILPAGSTVDIDVKNAPLADVLQAIARSEHMNIVIPDYIRGKVTVTAHKAPWNKLFERVLESNGLWYRYRKTNKIISIATRKDLDAQDE